MKITSLSLERFRSFSTLSLSDIGERTNILVGPNGSGKTNILEAIGFLSLGMSSLRAELEDVIHWKEGHFRVRADVLGREESEVLEVAAQAEPRRQKAFFVNDVRTPLKRFIGHLPTVSFFPEDLDLFTGSPSRRRSFLDTLLMQLSSEFLQNMREYERVVKQRNTLLRRIKDQEARPSDLSPWDAQVATLGAEVTLARLDLIERLNATLPEELRSLGETWDDPSIRYVRKTTAGDKEGISAHLLELLTHFRERDILVGSTTVGPHRDDFELLGNGRSIATFASRGQQRTALLTLLFEQVRYLASALHEQPIVLLDDVFSELDDRHQDLLLKHLGETQVFLTTTHLPPDVEGAVWRFTGDGTVSREA